MPQPNQWTNVPDGASGSSTVNASEAASSGAPDHSSGGETSSPSQVCRAGTRAPSPNATLISVKSAIPAPSAVALDLGAECQVGVARLRYGLDGARGDDGRAERGYLPRRRRRPDEQPRHAGLVGRMVQLRCRVRTLR